MLYIDDVIKRFVTMRKQEGNLEVCKVGHYGEINEMAINDIYITKASAGVFGDKVEKKVINIDTPDIGSEPD